MKLVAGSILLLAAVQAYAHANSIPFPNQQHASETLTPASLVLAVLGVVYLVWGTIAAVRGAGSQVSSNALNQ